MESLPPSTNASYLDPSDRSLAESSMESVVSMADADQGNNGNGAAARGKRPVWNVPSNGSVEAGPVMGGISWPSLSQSTKASPKSSTPSDSLKALSPGTVSDPPGPAAATSPQSKPSVNNSNVNPNSNHSALTRQKSVKHAGGGGGNGSGSQAPPLSPLVQSEKPKIIPDKLALQGPTLKTVHNNQHNISSSSNNNNPEQVSRGGAFLSQPHDGNDHHRSYGGNRRGNNGSGGPHFGNRQDQNRGNEWNHRNFGNRDAHLQQQQLPPQQRGPRPYFRPPALASTPFIPPFPPSARPFMGPIYPEIPSPVYYVTTHAPPESFRGTHFPAHPAPPAVFFPQPDPLRASLLRQVEHYFSRDNLVRDLFLRGKMDAQGWVPISLIAGFKKVKEIMQSEDIRINTQYILETMPASALVEVQVEGEKIRKRGDWMEWLLPARSGASTTSLSAQMHNVGLDG